MMSDELKIKFNSFHAQNIQAVKDFTNNMKAHPVDRNALETWRTEMLRRLKLNYDGTDLENLSEFVNRFANNLTNVSSVDFLTNFHVVLDDAIVHLRHNRTIILTMEDKVDKSSVWMSLLAWEKLRDLVTYIMSFEEVRQYIIDHPEETISILYIDDAAYSGSQATQNIAYNILHGTKKPRKNVEALFIIPYISSIAQNHIKEIFACEKWISNKTISFEKLYTNQEVKGWKLAISAPHYQYWVNYFGGRNIPNVFTLYFDHKLPDRISVYTQIIAYSPLIPEIGYNFDDIQLGNGFIVGCTRNTRQNPRTVLYVDVTADKEQPLCPHPVYKALGYTFNKKPIEPGEKLLDWLKVNHYICGHCGMDARFFSGGTITFCGKSCQASWYNHKSQQ